MAAVGMLNVLFSLSSLILTRAATTYYDISEYAEVFSPSGPRQSIMMPTKLGEILAYNNDLKVGDDRGTVVGFVNGNCIVSAEITDGIPNTAYECLETLVYTGGKYAGSALTVAGYYDFVENGPLAIVGGTGEFRGATGELNYAYPDNSSAYSIPRLVFVTPIFPNSMTCDPGSKNPNQCFNSDGSSFVCCTSACGTSRSTASCE